MKYESMLSLPDAIEKVTGQRPHYCTCVRWTETGVKGERLAFFKLGVKRVTTESLVLDFLRRTTKANEVKTSNPPSETRSSGEKSIDEIDATVLSELGI